MTYYDEWLGVISGYQAQLPVILAEYTFRTEKDIQDYLELISQIDEMYEEVIVFEEKKSEAGLFMADYVADEVIAQCEEFIADPEENYMLEIFEDKIEEFEGLTKEKKEEYIQETVSTCEESKITTCPGKIRLQHRFQRCYHIVYIVSCHHRKGNNHQCSPAGSLRVIQFKF